MRAICIASGPSLTQEDVDYCRGKGKVYVVNDAWRLAPWADVLYAADEAWWEHHKGVPEFAGEKWTVDRPAAKKYGLNHIGLAMGAAWSSWPGEVAYGCNSGFQTLNLSVIQGASEVVILGYDMGMTGGRKHFFGDHPGALNRGMKFEEWIKRFNRAAPLIEVPVINCSRETALTCFPRRALEDVL